MTTQQYTARYRRDDGIWLVEIDEIPQVHSFGRTLEQARSRILDALALWLEQEDGSSLLIRDRIEGISQQLADEISEAIATRGESARLAAQAREASARAARALVTDGGMSMRDAATLLHISHQRVHQ
ncbi:MAG TPA: type II toxin-antitoxin system HicB family antitoxin [Chloroflexota bacterium]|jgi:predicted RNase H-like HicB family nuclease|nr:type II toxin-antitoxin system HicB family antitoxin [Chloroflexota bacterium]